MGNIAVIEMTPKQTDKPEKKKIKGVYDHATDVI